jgi:multidrug efflux system membrane fusion protein
MRRLLKSFRLKAEATVIVLAGVTLAAGCADVEGRVEAPLRPIRVAEAGAPEGEARVRYSVSVQPDEQVTLSFKASGLVERVQQRSGADGRVHALQTGDRVRRGTVLAAVSEAEYRERLNQARATLREAEAAQTKAALDRQRAQFLFAARSLTKPDLDAAEANAEASAARVASARAQVESADIALRDCALVSPIDGVVLERRIERGMLVGPGTIGFVVASLAHVKAAFGVPDSLVHRLQPGQALGMTTPVFPQARFAGRISAIAPAADAESRVFTVEVSLPNRDGRLRPGMIGTIDIPLETRAAVAVPAAATVPLAAIVRAAAGQEGYAVFVAEAAGDGTVVRARPVTLGPASGNAVAVTTGLRPGERVVVMGATLVKDGDAVRVIP